MDFDPDLEREIEGDGNSPEPQRSYQSRSQPSGDVQPVDMAVIPDSKRELRACLVCGLIKTQQQFLKNGCENCERELYLKGNTQNISDFTTGNFFGIVSQMQPQNSWVSQFHRTNHFVPGCYALQVEGKLPPHMVRRLENRGIPYRNPEQYK